MTAIKAVQAKVQKGWSFTKTAVTYMMVWGLIFSLVTIGKLRVAFDYDDTLVFSTPAFQKSFQAGSQAFSPQFWANVNQNYDLEKPKIVTNALAWALRIFGFRITVLAARPPEGGEPLKKEWRRLVSRFVFASDPKARSAALAQGNHVLFLGDSDSDVQAGRSARILTLRIKRSSKSIYKEDYHPGTLREFVLPLSEY